jgi:NAD(P)-dependent dehydrogenase (short-subunit alcohol dehydrogenase family)
MKSIQSIRINNLDVSLPNKRAVVVGGTSGIGEGIALRFAKANASVTIVGRSRERGEELVKKMSAIGGKDHSFVSCDSFQMKNIVDTCNQLKAAHGNSVDYLVLTQGMATIQGRTETTEGIDQKLALHYFGRMLFVKELLPALRRAADADDVLNNPAHSGKVLSVLSAGVHGPFAKIDEDFELKHSYSIPNAADAAGFYNDLALDAYSRQEGNQKITFIHAAPGFVSTRWGTEMPWWIRGPVRALQLFGRSMEDCGEVMVDPIFNNKNGGLVLITSDGNPAPLTKAHTTALSDSVFQKTMDLFDRVLK